MDRLIREATGTVPYGVEHVIRTAESLERTSEIQDLPGRLGHGYLTSDHASRHGGLTSGQRRLDSEYELCLLGHTPPTSHLELPTGPNAKSAKHTATGSVALPLAVAVAEVASIPMRMIVSTSLTSKSGIFFHICLHSSLLAGHRKSCSSYVCNVFRTSRLATCWLGLVPARKLGRVGNLCSLPRW